MNVIDILILAVLGVSLIFGLYRGFISGVLSVAALIGAAAAAFAISPSLATWLQGNETLVNTLMYYTDAGSRIKDLDLSLLTVAQASQSAVAQIISGAQLPQQFQAAFINARRPDHPELRNGGALWRRRRTSAAHPPRARLRRARPRCPPCSARRSSTCRSRF